MARIHGVLVAAACVAFLSGQEPERTSASPIERAEKLLAQGKNDAAVEVLRSALGTDRLAKEERTFLARVLAWLGRSDEALDVLGKGLALGSADDDADLQWQIGELHQKLGDDGPFFRRQGAYVSYLPKDDKVDEKAWRNEHYRKALAAYAAVLARRADSERVTALVGELQQRLEQHEAALATWTAARERFPKSSAAHLGCARALASLGRAEDATAACVRAVQLAPRVAEAHAMLAELYTKAGKAEDAKKEQQQATFYEWVPEFLVLDFATAGASFALLAPQFDEEPSDEVKERVRKDRTAEIERLLATRNAETTRLLALLCYQHGDHGATEDRMFAELTARGADDVLRDLLENAQTTCTAKGAARALAQLRAPGILKVLLERLPRDVRPLWHCDIAGALAVLGDRAAVAPLIEFANLKPAEEKDDEEDFMLRQGREDARLRAVLALGVLGGDAAKDALQAGTGHAALGAGCVVALYRLTRDASMAEKAGAAVRAASGVQQSHLIEYLQDFAPELAKELKGADAKK